MDVNVVAAGADVDADGVGVDAYGVAGRLDGVESDVMAAAVDLAESQTGKFRISADGVDADSVTTTVGGIYSDMVAAPVCGRGSGEVASWPRCWQSQQHQYWKGRRVADNHPVMANDHSVVVSHCM